MRRLLLASLLFVLPACGEGAADGPPGAPAGPAERPPALVSVEAAGPPTLDRSFSVLGEVRTRHRAELAVGVDGTVLALEALEGERVNKGEVLVQVDDSVARAELAAAGAAVDEARVAVSRAEADLARYDKVSADVIAQAEVDRVRAEVASLRARLATAEARVAEVRARIARHAVRAPFSGAVVRRHADPGDWVTPGRVLVEVASTEKLDVLADVDPTLATLLEPGMGATLRVGGEDRPSTVAAIVPVLDPTTRTARVRLAPETTAGLLPGAPVTVVFHTTRALDVGARVPRDAVLPGPQGAAVVRVVGDAADRVEVRILAESPDQVLVDGITPGDQVVTRGNERLRPGQPVRIAGAPAGGPPG